MVPPPLGGASRTIHTSRPWNWQYTYRDAFKNAGPDLKRKTTRTNVGQNSETMKKILPMAIKLQPPLRFALPQITNTEKGREMMGFTVANIIDPQHQATMNSEADVIQEAGPYFLKVVQDLAPYYIVAAGLKGKFDMRREFTNDISRPDVIMNYDGEIIMAIDYKGPNCIYRKELELCSATSVSDALKRLHQPQSEAADAKRRGRPQKSPGDRTSSLVYGEGVNKDTEALLKQGMKYRSNVGARLIMFYDYEHLMIMKPPADLEEGNQYLMDVVLCSESTKSTEGNLVQMADNHVNVLMRYIIAECTRVAKAKASVAKSKAGVAKTGASVARTGAISGDKLKK